MSVSFRKFYEGLKLILKATTTATEAGQLEALSSDNRLRYHDGVSSVPVVTQSSVDTLTNKTLTSPVINAPTGITKSDVGLANVDNTSDATKNAATATLTNKTIDGDDNTVQDLPLTALKTQIGQANTYLTRDASGIVVSTVAAPTSAAVGVNDVQTLTNKSLVDNSTSIVDAGDATKKIKFDASGTTATTTTLQSSQTSNQVITLPDVTDTLVARTTTDTLSNKTLNNTNVITVKDSNLTIQDDIDVTKQVKFQASGLTTATTRTLTVPDGDTTLVGTNLTQTLTGKTLTAPVISTIVNTGTLTLPTSTDTLVGRATTDTLTNKTLTSPVINTGVFDVETLTNQGSTPATPASGFTKFYSKTADKKLYYLNDAGVEQQVGSGSGGAINYVTNPDAETDTSGYSAFSEQVSVVNATVNSGNVSGNVVTFPVAHGLSNNQPFIYTTSLGFITPLVSGTTYYAIVINTTALSFAATSGGSAITLTGAAGVSTVSLSSVAYPSVGTGGTPTVTLTRSTSSPLRGAASFLFTKTAVNSQGQGFAYPFTIANADLGKVLTFSMDYAVASGTYANADMSLWIYDVTNAVMIQPAGYTILNATTGFPQRQIATFQTASNSTSYRAVWFVGSTSASAYTVKFDNIVIGPQVVQYGAPVTDWKVFPMVITGSTSNPTRASSPVFDQAEWRRVGDSMEIRYNYKQTSATGAAAGSGSYYFALPSGFAIDTSKVTPNGGGNIGPATVTDNLSGTGVGYVAYQTATTFALRILNETTAINTAGAGIWGDFSRTSVDISFTSIVPIVGWASTVQMSNDTDTRVIAMQVSQASPTATITGSFSLLKYTSGVSKDTAGGFNTTTGLYTVPVSGFYRCTASAGVSATYTINSATNIGVALDGTMVQQGIVVAQSATVSNLYPTISVTIYCNAGQTLSPVITSTGSTPTIQAAASVNYFDVERLSGPSAIAATESVNMRYDNTAGTSVPNSASDNNIPFATKSFDSHNAYNTSTGIYTVPVSGKYRISGTLNFGNATYAPTNLAIASVYKNNVVSAYGIQMQLTGAVTLGTSSSVTATVSCNAGDTLEIRGQNTRTAGATTLATFNGANHIEIERVGQ